MVLDKPWKNLSLTQFQYMVSEILFWYCKLTWFNFCSNLVPKEAHFSLISFQFHRTEPLTHDMVLFLGILFMVLLLGILFSKLVIAFPM